MCPFQIGRIAGQTAAQSGCPQSQDPPRGFDCAASAQLSLQNCFPSRSTVASVQ
jgi:hypothetical protein